MSTALWDPANLLQISYEIDSPGTSIFCVGEARGRSEKPRCRYTILEPDAVKVRSILSQLSAKEPQVVQLETLLSLARLCLCDGYHKSQATEVADRWLGIVSQAAQHRSFQPASAASSSAPKAGMWDSSHGLFLELKKAQDEVKLTSAKCKRLEEDLATKTEELSKRTREAERESSMTLQREQATRAEVISVQEKMDRLKEETKTLRNKLLEYGEKSQRLEVSTSQFEEERRAHGEELDAVRNKLLAATERAEHLEAECSRANEEVAVLKSEKAGLGKENSVILAAIKQMEAERDAARGSHKQATLELAEKRRSILELQNEVHSLQLDRVSLQQSIAACWLHRLLAWITRFRISDDFKCGK